MGPKNMSKKISKFFFKKLFFSRKGEFLHKNAEPHAALPKNKKKKRKREKVTNETNLGWISGDRCKLGNSNTEQYPVCVLSRLQMIYEVPNLTLLCGSPRRPYGPGVHEAPYRSINRSGTTKITRASRVSGLEAFSRYPTHGSFWPMVFRPNQFTGRARPWFLSY